jgi:hypothetical protein
MNKKSYFLSYFTEPVLCHHTIIFKATLQSLQHHYITEDSLTIACLHAIKHNPGIITYKFTSVNSAVFKK